MARSQQFKLSFYYCKRTNATKWYNMLLRFMAFLKAKQPEEKEIESPTERRHCFQFGKNHICHCCLTEELWKEKENTILNIRLSKIVNITNSTIVKEGTREIYCPLSESRMIRSSHFLCVRFQVQAKDKEPMTKVSSLPFFQ